MNKICSRLILLGLFLSLAGTPALANTPPVVKEARLITNTFIELHWEGQRYMNDAGRSRENIAFDAANNFEVNLDDTVLAQNFPWYWNITNMSLNGVWLNQNITTLRLSRALTNAQMTAIQDGTSALTVRITNATSNVTGSNLFIVSTPANAPIRQSAIGPPGAPADATTVYNVVHKPYYDKEIRSPVAEIRIRGSEFVNIETLHEAGRMIDVILSAAPPALVANMRANNTFVIFGPGEHSYNIPEHRSIFLNRNAEGRFTDNWSRAEGYGGRIAATSAANVHRNHVARVPFYPPTYVSRYRDESILAHEFGHGVHSAFNAVYPANDPLRQELMNAFNNSRNRNMWTPYIRDARSGGEYFATLTAVWYNAMANGNSVNCNTRDEFFKYDRKGYDFFAQLFSHDHKELSPTWLIPPGAAPDWTIGDAEPFSNPSTEPSD